jgi:hypothetical protein
MELQTLFEMEDKAVSESVYHVVSSVPDFQTKLADSRPACLALLCLFKNGGGEGSEKPIAMYKIASHPIIFSNFFIPYSR